MENSFFKHLIFQVDRKDLFNGDLDILVPQIPKECERLNVEIIVSSISIEKKEPPKEKLPRKNRRYKNYIQAVKRARKS